MGLRLPQGGYDSQAAASLHEKTVRKDGFSHQADMRAKNMRITDIESLRAGQVSSVTPTQAAATQVKTAAQAYGKGATPAAQVEFSAQAQAIAVAAVAVDQAPDVREGLVAKLKSQVDAGTYHVGGKNIADQILRRAQADRLQ